MIPVMQDKFGYGGNCMSAAIASMLNKTLDQVPYFAEGLTDQTKDEENAKIFFNRIKEYLEKLGCELLWYPLDQKDFKEKIIDAGSYYLVSGKSPRGYSHVVIYRNGELAHDPHPEGGGVIPEHVGALFSLENLVKISGEI